jgi:hypothetical protein
LKVVDLQPINLSQVQEKSSSSDPLTKSKDKSGSNEMSNLLLTPSDKRFEESSIQEQEETLKQIAKRNNIQRRKTGIRRLQTSQEFNFINSQKKKSLKKSTSKDLSYKSGHKKNKSHRRINSDFSFKPSKSILKKPSASGNDTRSYFSQMSNASNTESKKVSFKPTKTIFYVKKYNNNPNKTRKSDYWSNFN